jgi:molybdate transport system regulatory protein
MPHAPIPVRVLPRWRIYFGEDIAVGPGKVELLEHIKQSGSLLEAAQRMEMSYMRAWLLIKTMNRCFREPLVCFKRGGKEGGGAVLSPTGEKALALYQQLEKKSLSATQSIQSQFTALFR